MSSLAKSINIKEISIDNNPVFLEGDCISFLVSYIPQLAKLNNMIITEQVRKAAMAWRRNKEITSTTYMELTSNISLNYRREEVISNARTNWELLRSQTKCLTNNVSSVDKTLKDLKPDSDFVLTSLAKVGNIKTACSTNSLTKSKIATNMLIKVPVLADKKISALHRTSSQDTDNSSQNTSTSNNCSNDTFKLPPILVPIINKLEQRHDEAGLRISTTGSSSSSIGPNVDSSVSSLTSDAVENQIDYDSLYSSDSSSESEESDVKEVIVDSIVTQDVAEHEL